MRPEDITEQDENGKIKDTEGQLAADENRNETVETEVSQETHSEYKRRAETRTTSNFALNEAVGRRTLQQGGEYCRTYHAIPSARRCFYR